MQEKVNHIIQQTVQALEEDINSLMQASSLTNENLTSIFIQRFTEAFDKAENDEMQKAVYKELARIFHPDRFDNEKFKYASHLKKQGFSQLPQQILSEINENLIKEKLPQFSENFLEWLSFVGELLYQIFLLETNSQKYKTARKKLDKNAFTLSKIYSMWEGLGSYFSLLEYAAKILMGFLLVSSLIAFMIIYGVTELVKQVLRPPRAAMIALIKFIASDEFHRQFLKEKESAFQELFKLFSTVIEEGQNPEQVQQDLRFRHNSAIEDGINDNSLLRLKLIALAFFHSLFKDISGESAGNKALFILSWPFRLIGMTILFILAAPIELTRLALDYTLIAFLFVCVAANASLLFALNLPLYIFFEIPRAFINWVKSEPNSGISKEIIADDPNKPHETVILSLEYNPDPTNKPKPPLTPAQKSSKDEAQSNLNDEVHDDENKKLKNN